VLTVKEFIPPQKRVLEFKEEVYERVDKIFAYLMFAYFGFGMFLAFFHDTWGIGFVMGGANLLISFTMFYFNITPQIRRFVLSLQLFVFVLQFILQSEGSLYAQFTFFFTLTVLIFYQNPRLLIPYFVAGVFYYGIGIFASYEGNEEIQRYFIYKSEFSVQEALPPLLVAVSQLAICLFFAYYLDKQTYENAKNAIYLEEQLNIEQNTELAKQIAQGNLYESYTPKPNDVMGNALLEMREKLKKIREKDEENAWLSVGISRISSILLQSEDINILAEKLLDEIVKYLNTPYGALYALDEYNNEPCLVLKAYYAPQHSEKLHQQFAIGEGLIGEVAKRMKTIYLDEVPPQFQFISSGLGMALPKSILIVPLTSKQQLTGIIEVASFQHFSKREIELLEKVSENIALNLLSAKANEKTNKLLYEAQIANMQLQLQDEQLRKTIEKHQQDQQELLEKQRKLEETEAQNKELIDKLQTMMREQEDLLMSNTMEVEMQQLRYKKLEIEVEHLKAKYDKQLNTVNGCILTMQMDNKALIVEASGKIEFIFGCPADDLLNHSFYDYIHPDDQPTLREIYQSGLPTYQMLFHIVKQDGSVIKVEETAFLTEDNFGTAQRMAFLYSLNT